jgi:putative FmdB family regulatory protein
MPLYEYKCPNGHLTEVFHGMTEPRPEVCGVCGEGPLQTVLHPVAVHYKGSGFYSTDYGRGGRKAKDNASSESSGSGEKSSSSESSSGSGSDSSSSSSDGGSSETKSKPKTTDS